MMPGFKITSAPPNKSGGAPSVKDREDLQPEQEFLELW
jgi:hypothetical protein